MSVAKVPKLTQECGWRRGIATLALDRLDQDRRDRRRRDLRAGQLSQAVHRRLGRSRVVASMIAIRCRERRQVHPGKERLVSDAVVERRAGHRRRPEGAPMEGVAKGDDPRPSGHAAGELERRLDGFRARVQEHDRIERVGKCGVQLGRQTRDRLGESEGGDRADEPIHLRMDCGGHSGVGMAKRGHRDPVGEVEVRLPGGVVQPMPDAVAPRSLEVAPQDGGQARRSRRLIGRGHVCVIGRGVGRHGRSGLHGDGIDRVYGSLRRRCALLLASRRGRLQPDGRESPGPGQRARLCRGGDPASHPPLGRAGRGPSRALLEDGRARVSRRPDPGSLRRQRDGLPQLRHPVRGAGTRRHRFSGGPERPRRPELADAPPVGDRGATPALARATGTRREAGDLRADRARGGDGRG